MTHFEYGSCFVHNNSFSVCFPVSRFFFFSFEYLVYFYRARFSMVGEYLNGWKIKLVKRMFFFTVGVRKTASVPCCCCNAIHLNGKIQNSRCFWKSKQIKFRTKFSRRICRFIHLFIFLSSFRFFFRSFFFHFVPSFSEEWTFLPKTLQHRKQNACISF